jgi:hypothetical protein
VLAVKKIEITEEMIDRAILGFDGGAAKWGEGARSAMCRALESALQAPTKPEIEVTAVMIGEGHKAARNALEQRPRSYADEYVYNDRCYLTELPYTAIYRAMRKLEPPQARPSTLGGVDRLGCIPPRYWVHKRAGEGGLTDERLAHVHRRATDPDGPVWPEGARGTSVIKHFGIWKHRRAGDAGGLDGCIPHRRKDDV